MTSLPNYIECVCLLLQHSVPSNVINHLVFTTQTAMEISAQLKNHGHKSLNCDLILAGAMLHDIGRSKTHDINHGLVGAKILRRLNLPEELARISEVHLFAGIAKQETKDLGLPYQDYLPLTLEEKIITYADNVSKGHTRLSTEEVIMRYTRYLSHSHSILLRVRILHETIENKLNKVKG